MYGVYKNAIKNEEQVTIPTPEEFQLKDSWFRIRSVVKTKEDASEGLQFVY